MAIDLGKEPPLEVGGATIDPYPAKQNMPAAWKGFSRRPSRY